MTRYPNYTQQSTMTTINSTLRLRVISHYMVVFLGLLFLAVPAWLLADTAQYYYDELGRLVGVVDGQGDAAVYNYDAVGNLLSIQRFTSSGAGVGIFLIAPASSVVNKNVEIRGFGFTTPPSSNQVQFNGTPATVVSGSGVSLIVTVPAGATTGPVTVTNTNGTGTSPQVFTVLVPPIITGIDPPNVPQGTTTRLNVEGFNLLTASSVQFTQSGLTATILAGGTSATLPISLAVASTVPVGPYEFSVTSPQGTAQSGTVTLTVGPSIPTFEISKPGSVFVPSPSPQSPSPGQVPIMAIPGSVAMP